MARKLNGWTVACLKEAAIPIFALANNSYSYRKLRRRLIAKVAALSKLKAAEMENPGWLWFLAADAALFNPIFPVHVSGGIWLAFHIVLASIPGILVLLVYQRTPLKTCQRQMK